MKKKKEQIKWPKLSVIICTYNCKDDAKKCFETIKSQDYPGELELIASDGGSTDGTVEALEKIGVKVLYNKEKLPEGKGRGKWLGYKNAKGEVIMIIDSDNFPIEKDWVKKMVKPLVVDESVGFCISRMAVVKTDKIVNRYLSLVGPDPFVSYRSMDGLLPLNKLKLKDKGDYQTYDIKLKKFLITGGNYFTIKKKTLEKIGGYTHDVNVVYNLAKNNLGRVAIPKDATLHHLIIKDIKKFVKKKFWWATVFFQKQVHDASRDFNWMPKTNMEKVSLSLRILNNLILIPNTVIGIKMAVKDRESAWLLHPIMMWLTTASYLGAYFYSKFKKSD